MASPTGMLTQALLDGTSHEHWAGYSRISIGEATIAGWTPCAPVEVPANGHFHGLAPAFGAIWQAVIQRSADD
jgi:hypothetical protein